MRHGGVLVGVLIGVMIGVITGVMIRMIMGGVVGIIVGQRCGFYRVYYRAYEDTICTCAMVGYKVSAKAISKLGGRAVVSRFRAGG